MAKTVVTWANGTSHCVDREDNFFTLVCEPITRFTIAAKGLTIQSFSVEGLMRHDITVICYRRNSLRIYYYHITFLVVTMS